MDRGLAGFLISVAVVEVEVVFALLAESAEEEDEVDEGGVMISHWGSGSDGLSEDGRGRRRVMGRSASSSEDAEEESLSGESSMRLDSLGWKWMVVVAVCR